MTKFTALKKIPQNHVFQKGDLFVLIGELFHRGYANGLVEMAKKHEMTIIGTTMGRRNSDKQLRALNAEELTQVEAILGSQIINIPLEAGFDLDNASNGLSPVDMLKDLKKDDWSTFKFNWQFIEEAYENSKQRFQASLKAIMQEIKKQMRPGQNVFFAHAMAGGIPRAKIYMPIINRIFKGRDKRFLSSDEFWHCDLGKLCAKNFNEVTAMSFQYLLDSSQEIRDEVKAWNGEVCYTAFGYHGTEVLINDQYQWQTYTPYKQGDAKIILENTAIQAWEQGIKAIVYNAPEIRTNSSDIFAGVELSLFPLIASLKKFHQSQWAQTIIQKCQEKLQDHISIDYLLASIEDYYQNAVIHSFQNYDQWPMDNTVELAEICIGKSEELINLHKDQKDLITDLLSQLVIESTGYLMFHNTGTPSRPVEWIGHDIIAENLVQEHS